MSQGIKVNKKRIVDEFLELTSMDSVSFHEREMADKLTVKLKELGFEVTEDHAGKVYNGTAGNLFAVLKGQLQGEAILLSGHMDTVAPGIGKKSVLLEDGTIVSNKETVLGADDATALAEILEGIRAVKEAAVPHRDIEILFSIAEEPYCRGSAVFDFTKVKAREAYVLDMTGPIGHAILQAPTILSFTVKIKGKASHAGFEPEKGIHSIFLMSKAISALKLGHLDADTTLNVGLINGGSVTNTVPALSSCKGEIRSYKHDRALEVLEYVKKTFEAAVEGSGAELVVDCQADVAAYHIEENEEVVQRFFESCKALHIKPTTGATFGGSDNNYFALNGIRGIVLSCGMYNPHTINEYTRTEDLYTGAKLIAELITR